MNINDYQQALDSLKSIPSLNCGFYPTPLEELTCLRKMLGGGPRIFIKRDDFTGIGFGGNKVRKLEYVLAKAVAEGVEVAITIGTEKSNHARITAALCARLGLCCILVLSPATSGTIPPNLKPASRFIYETLKAEIHMVENREQRSETAEMIAADLSEKGKKVVNVPLGASVPLGALGFVSAMQETAVQLRQLEVTLNYIFHASTSGGTQAGLIVGCHMAGYENTRVVGVSPDDPANVIATKVVEIANGCYKLLKMHNCLSFDQVKVLDEYIGPGYGLDTPDSIESFNLLAASEGIFLDPIYTSKAMAALLDWVRKGKLTDQDTVLFWHTGGQTALFFTPA